MVFCETSKRISSIKLQQNAVDNIINVTTSNAFEETSRCASIDLPFVERRENCVEFSCNFSISMNYIDEVAISWIVDRSSDCGWSVLLLLFWRWNQCSVDELLLNNLFCWFWKRLVRISGVDSVSQSLPFPPPSDFDHTKRTKCITGKVCFVHVFLSEEFFRKRKFP